MGVTLVTLTGGEPFLREADDRLITRAAARVPRPGISRLHEREPH